MQSPEARLFAQAFQALNEGRLTDAEQGFKKFLRSNQRHPGALNLYSILLLRSGRFEDAEPVLRKAISVDPSSDVTFYNYGLTLKHLGKPEAALEAFSKSIAIKQANPEAWNSRGTVLKEIGRHSEAIRDFDQAIALAPGYADAHANRGNALVAEGRMSDAAAAYDRATTLRPDLAEAWIGKGNVLAANAKHSEAISAFEQAAKLRPDLAEAWVGCGTALSHAGNPDIAVSAFNNALSAYQAALKTRPNHTESWIGCAHVLMNLKRFDEALDASAKAVRLDPRNAGVLRARGGILFAMKRPADALKAFDDALRLDPALAEAFTDRGTVLNELRRFDEAGSAFDKALAIKPASAEAWLGRGNTFFGLLRYDDAIATYQRAVALRQDLAEAWFGIASALARLRRIDDALSAYDDVIRIRPGLAEAWIGKGTIYSDLRQADPALACFDRALALDSGLPEAWYAKGSFFIEAAEFEQAADAFERAFAGRADQNFIKGYIAFAHAQICNWPPFEPMRRDCVADIAAGRPAATPFIALACATTAAEQFACARTHASFSYPLAGALKTVPAPAGSDNGRIRLAYLCGDFRDHPVSQLAVGVFERHDRSRFETVALSTGPDDGSDLRRRIEATFDQFHDVRMQSDGDIARLIEQLGCDVVVDLTGLTQGGRTALLASKPAPVQVNWLGFAGTTGADFMDYIIADHVVIPPQIEPFFTEKVVKLPGCYLPNDSTRAIAAYVPSRADQGLPEQAFVYCSFNNSYKITAGIFERWMNLLRQLDNSVLWLSRMNDAARANLQKEAERRGIASDRLIFARRAERQEDHLARLRLADLFLDTPGYNAHATSCDALWAGVPVLTCMGDTFAGRVAASALTALEIPELIVDTLDGYEELAIDLARDPRRLAGLRSRIAANRSTAALFDTERFTRQIEAAYVAMHERALRGESPMAFAVEPL